MATTVNGRVAESIGLLTVTSVCHLMRQHTVFALDSHSADQTHELGIWQAQFEANMVALALNEEAETLMSERLCESRGSEIADARDISTHLTYAHTLSRR